MEQRALGTTGLRVSALGFGCGAVGGILLQGDAALRRRAVALAVDLGVTFFDTAAAYGDGLSETNLGLALRDFTAATRGGLVLASKIRLGPRDRGAIGAAVARRIDESLARLGIDRIDLMQLHNPVGDTADPGSGRLTPAELEQVLAAFGQARAAGKIGHWGINGLGDVAALHRCLGLPVHTIQVCHNLLNPTAGTAAPAGFPFADQRQMIAAAAGRGIGVLAFRLLAGGALSGSAARHANATAQVDTILSAALYDHDLLLARGFAALVAAGHADSLVELAIRFGIGTPGVSCAVLGFSDAGQISTAVRHADRGPLPAGARDAIEGVWALWNTHRSDGAAR